MKPLIITLYLICSALAGSTQGMNEYMEIDRIALNIPGVQTNTTADIATYIKSNFDTDSKKVRAVYAWVTTNMKYDKDSPHLAILNEDREQKIIAALKRKKGVCENFATIFSDICIKSGLKSFVIEGNARLLYAHKNGIQKVKCIIVNGVSTDLPSSGCYLLNQLLISDKFKSGGDRYKHFQKDLFRKIEETIHDPVNSLL